MDKYERSIDVILYCKTKLEIIHWCEDLASELTVNNNVQE